MYKTNNARLLVHLWAEIMHSVLDSPPGYTALGPADLGAVYPGALLAHRALFGPECTRTRALSVYYSPLLGGLFKLENATTLAF